MSASPDPLEAVLASVVAEPAGPVELFLWLRASGDPRPAIESALRAAGGRLVWSARAERLLIGEGELHWTHAALVQGPGLRAVLDALRRNARAAGLFEVASRRFERVRVPAPARAILALLRAIGRRRRPAARDPDLLELPSGLAASAINPPLERLRALARDPSPAPAFMINLLSYRERARYAENERGPDLSGRAAYRRYGAVAARGVALLGGEIEHLGALGAPIADREGLATSGEWNELAIVRYPRPRSLLELEGMPGYARALRHRNAGLSRTALVVSR